ncbi:MAG: hypothetical protein AB7U34_07465, partial [Novosphingobium sp.]
VEKKLVPVDPPQPLVVESCAAQVEPAEDNNRRFASWPRAIGPPPAETTYLPLNPRAPPIA